MADYNSKYTGQQVEALLDIVSQGGGSGGGEGEVQKTTETEILAMGFTKNQGTITEVKMNGESKGTSGVVDLGTVITAHQDISGKQDVISDLETIRSNSQWTHDLRRAIQPFMFEGAVAVEIPSGLISDEALAYALPTSGYIDVADDVLLSRSKVKTINGESIYGSGDITISGGGVTEDFVNNAIANAITTTLNTAV